MLDISRNLWQDGAVTLKGRGNDSQKEQGGRVREEKGRR